MYRSKDSSFLPINKYLKTFTFNGIYDLNPRKVISLPLFIYIIGASISSD